MLYQTDVTPVCTTPEPPTTPDCSNLSCDPAPTCADDEELVLVYEAQNDCECDYWRCDAPTTEPPPTTPNPEGQCIANRETDNVQMCTALMWTCHEPEAYDMLGAAGHHAPRDSCIEWTDNGCCYQDDNGAACDREQLLSSGDAIFGEWFAILNNCTSYANALIERESICKFENSI